MKNIKFLYLALIALVVGSLTACQEEWTPGEADSAQSVYLSLSEENAVFPVGENVAEYPIYRQVAGPELQVEIRSRMLDEIFEGSDIFTFDEYVTFAEGETVAYLTVTLREDLTINVGETYKAEIMIKDPQYHGNYGLSRRVINVGIPETWNDFGKNEDGTDKNPKLGKFFDDVIGPLYGSAPSAADVTIEESASRKGYYRLVNPYTAENVVNFIGGIPSEITFLNVDHYIEIDARDPEGVYVNLSYLGFLFLGSEAYVATINPNEPSLLGKLEDGVITFPANSMIFIDNLEAGSGYYANQSGMFKVVLPGTVLTDYSIAPEFRGIQSSVDNSYSPAVVGFKLGADVASFRFAVVEGDEPIMTGGSSGPSIGGGGEQTYHEAIVKLLDDEYEPTDDENFAEATAEETEWYVDLPKAGLYTVFAIPYNKAGEPVMDEIARTYFYYRSANMDDAVPELTDTKIVLAPIASLMGDEYETNYPGEYYLGISIRNNEDYPYFSTISVYFTETATIEEELAEATIEELVAEKGEDFSFMVDEIKAAKGSVQVLQGLVPNTEYTALVAYTSIYGKTYYKRVDAKTNPYDGPIAVGHYKMVDGDNELNVTVEPAFHLGAKVETILLTFDAPEYPEGVDVEERTENFSFYSFFREDLNCLLSQGQAPGLEDYGILFGVGLDKYNEDGSQYWSFASSTDADYESDYEAMVVNLSKSAGVYTPDNLYTYFKQYYYYTERIEDPETEEVTEILHKVDIAAFTPEGTKFEFVAPLWEAEPEQPEDEENGEQNGEQNGDENGEQNTEPVAVRQAPRPGKFTGNFVPTLRTDLQLQNATFVK